MDDVLDVGDVESAGGHVGGDEQGAVVAAEAFQTLEPLLLLHLRVQRQRLLLPNTEQKTIEMRTRRARSNGGKLL